MKRISQPKAGEEEGTVPIEVLVALLPCQGPPCHILISFSDDMQNLTRLVMSLTRDERSHDARKHTTRLKRALTPLTRSVPQSLVAPSWRDWSITRGCGEYLSFFGIKTISQPGSGRARLSTPRHTSDNQPRILLRN